MKTQPEGMLQHRYGHMVHEYYVSRVADIMARRRERLDALRTRADAEAYVRQVRRAVARAFGPLPERTPLNARVTGRLAFRTYDIEKVVFESRPGFLVTANLYLPRSAAPAGRRPAVLGLCGHGVLGKVHDLYQSFCQGLAGKGFIVLIIDPIYQGERQQFYRPDGVPRPGLCVGHNLMGNQMVLTGDYFGTWRVWDAIRALDYLLTRPEVDPARVGVTGNSGGGTLTSFVAALDPRPTMVAPSCYICSWLANLRNELPADAEQNPPGVLASGLDEADLLLCHAPRPTLILGQHDDMFDARATRRAGEELKRVHALLGSPGSAGCFIGPRHHGFFKENREAMLAFFMKHAGVSGTAREGRVRALAPRELWATPRGDTGLAGSRRVIDFTISSAEAARRRRGRPALPAVRAAAARLLGLGGLPRVRAGARPLFAAPPAYRCLRGTGGIDKGLNCGSQFGVETEPRIQAIVTTYGRRHPVMHPPTGRVTLYVGHISGRDDVRAVPAVRALTRGRQSLAVVDPRGIGETLARSCGSQKFFEPYGNDYLYAATGEMLGESYLGRRVFDVLRTIDFLLDGGATDVRLMGRGLGAVTAAFAALLHPAEPDVRLVNYLPSYELIARSPIYSWPLSSLLRGCLNHFDLPDVYRVLGRRLTVSGVWDERMRG